ncbi:MAG TPA: hypothetical protein DD850_12910 [Erwinia persicina]|nr:hypothetical protein [Erwinia persicina]
MQQSSDPADPVLNPIYAMKQQQSAEWQAKYQPDQVRMVTETGKTIIYSGKHNVILAGQGGTLPPAAGDHRTRSNGACISIICK